MCVYLGITQFRSQEDQTSLQLSAQLSAEEIFQNNIETCSEFTEQFQFEQLKNMHIRVLNAQSL